MIGLYKAEVLAQRTGNSDIRGVTNEASCQVPTMEITANGVQAKIHRQMLMMATLAARISAETASWSELLRREVTFIFLACWRNSSSCLKIALTMKKYEPMIIRIGNPYINQHDPKI